MAKIESYNLAQSPLSGSDKLIGTDVSDSNATKNFSISELITFIAGSGSFVPYTGATQDLDLASFDLLGANVSLSGTVQSASVNATFDILINGNKGTSGQVLTSQGIGLPTVWQTPSLGYKQYVAVISQSGTSAPTETYLLKNTFTTPLSFAYFAVGRYRLNCTFEFTSSKTIVFINPGFPPDGFTVGWEYNSDSQLTIHVRDKNGSYANDLLFNASIEVRVYS